MLPFWVLRRWHGKKLNPNPDIFMFSGVPDKSLRIPKLPGSFSGEKLAEIQSFMDHSEKHPVDVENWDHAEEKPTVSFSIAWNNNDIFLKFFVSEAETKGTFTRDNDPVYRDSCVEFFFSPSGNNNYFNIETNCIGTCLVQKGTSRYDRSFLDPEKIREIIRIPSLGRKPVGVSHGPVSWNLFLKIPVDRLTGLHLNSLKGKVFKANFYKCGDDLSNPHYLSWNPVRTESPDFHRPEFFAPVEFIGK